MPNGGKTFLETLANLVVLRSETREQSAWIHSDILKHMVYFNLNNEGKIARISPEAVEIVQNGNNDAKIILSDSKKIQPISYIPGVNPDEARSELNDIAKYFTCTPEDRRIITACLSSFLLIELASTRPITRFEGSHDSGKTTASKLLSTLVYGQEQQNKPTRASMYSDGSRNPFIFRDNLET